MKCSDATAATPPGEDRGRASRRRLITLVVAIAALNGCSGSGHTSTDELSQLKAARLDILSGLKDIVSSLGSAPRTTGFSSGRYSACGKTYRQATAGAWQYKTATSFIPSRVRADDPNALAAIRDRLLERDWTAIPDPSGHRHWMMMGRNTATGVLESGDDTDPNDGLRPPKITVTLVSRCFSVDETEARLRTSPEDISKRIGLQG